MFNVSEEVDVHVGTLSKAIGSQGGFVACSRGVKKLLLNRGRPYVFSTSLAGPSVAAASAAISVLQQVNYLLSLISYKLRFSVFSIVEIFYI